jgi:predicted nucleic acid-binding protein
LIFLDTGFLYALFAEEDEHHLRVQEVLEEYQERRLSDLVITTNFVVGETLTLARSKGHPDPGVRHDRAVEIGQHLRAGYFAQIYRVSEEDEEAAFDLFRRHRDQEYSFVDCLSFVVMDKLAIREAFSVDKHFTHRFTAIPGPLPK